MWQTLHDAGLDPASRRSGPTSRQFLTAQAKTILAGDFVTVETVMLRRIASPPQAPPANAICERMIATLRRELFDKVLVVNQRHPRRLLTIYPHHVNNTRPHRTLAPLAPAQAETQPPPVVNLADHQVRRRPILDGLTNEYQIAE